MRLSMNKLRTIENIYVALRYKVGKIIDSETVVHNNYDVGMEFGMPKGV